MSSPTSASDVVYVGIGDDSLVPELLDSSDHKSPHSADVKHIDVVITYPHVIDKGTTVYIQSSHDKFETFTEMSPVDSSSLPTKVFISLSLPLGTLLYRFYVERETTGGEEFVTDESVEVVYVDGNEYNLLHIEEEDEDDDDDDNASIKSTSSSSPSSSPSPTPSSPTLNSSSSPPTSSHSLASVMGMTSAGGSLLEKKKKKKRKNKKKHNADSVTSPSNATNAVAPTSSLSTAAFDKLKSDFSKKESEWRDALLLFDLRASESSKLREDKIRDSFKEERSKWLKYIKELKVSEENSKKELVNLQNQMDEVRAMSELDTKQKSDQSVGWAEQQKKILLSQSQWQKEKDELAQQIVQLKSELLSLAKSREEEKSTLLSAVKSLKSSCDDLTSKLSVSESDLSTLKSKYSEMQNVLQKTKNDFVKEKTFLKKRTMDPAEMKEMIDMVSGGLRKEIDEWKAKSEDWEKKYSEAKTEKLKLDEKVSSVSSASADVSELKNQIVDLQSQLESKERKVQSTIEENGKNAEILKNQFTIQQKVLNDQISLLTAENEEKDKTYSSTLQELNVKKNEIIELEGKVKSAVENQKEIQKKIDELNGEIEKRGKSLNANAEEWKAKESQWTSDRTKLDAELKDKDAKLLVLNSQIIDSQRLLSESKMDLEKLEMKLKLREAAFIREKSESERKITEFNKMKTEIEGKVSDINKAKQSILTTLSTVRTDIVSLSSSFNSEFALSRRSILDGLAAQGVELLSAVQKYKKESSLRRKYFNLVQELKGNIRVFCRVRPAIEEDKRKGASTCITYPPSEMDSQSMVLMTVANGKEKKNPFEFDRVFQMASTQEEVFSETKDLVQSTMDGYNVCIFAYGQTGSGKTFTMSGIESNRGVNYRSLNELFRIRDERKDDYDYTISVSMKEIYNETIRDLLDPKDKGELKIRQTATGSMYVEDLKEFPVNNEEDVIRCMNEGNKNRTTGSTNMNELSSRSHSLLSVNVVGVHKSAGITYFGKLHLIDLAGSERLSRTEATGDRLKEAQAINKSLAALGNVIEALQKKQSHIPYRNSKLTYILQDSLGGHAKTLMFINVSPNDMDADETLCSLNFATRVRQVELGTAARSVVHSQDDAVSAEGGEEKAESVEKSQAPTAAPSPTPSVKKVSASSSTTKMGASASSSLIKKVSAPLKSSVTATPIKSTAKVSTPSSAPTVARRGSTTATATATKK